MYNKKIEEDYLRKASNFRNRISRLILSEKIPFNVSCYVSEEPIALKESINLPRKPVNRGEVWGKAWDSGYFLLEVDTPEHWYGYQIAASLNFGGEALVYSEEGVPLYGLTNGSVFATDYAKDLYRIGEAKGKEHIKIFVEAAANGLFGINRDPELPSFHPHFHGWYDPKLEYADICIFNPELWHLMLDLDILINLAYDLPERSVRRERIVRTLNDAVNQFADNVLNAKLCRDILKIELSKKNSDTVLTAFAVGHSHIDTGWLWRTRETMRKTARTWASQLDLMEKYPSYVYGASQPAQYLMIKNNYPELYKKVKEAVKKGQWELQGAMWVEADCNIINGESMARQFIHGKNFFMDEFGVDVKNLWLPDVFGYSGNLPQIMKKSGVDFFMTMKLSWNRYNTFPYTTFVWEGIDGSEVISHFAPNLNYNDNLTPSSLRNAEKGFYEKDRLGCFLEAFGIGDGGGGPKEEYIERGLRMQNLEGVPLCKFSKASDLFEILMTQKEKFDRWKGELYLEIHRGTLTTQAKMKKLNRLAENMLRKAEFVASLVFQDYPLLEFDSLWKTLLLNQFHDILPGSSIHAVYEDAWKDLENIISSCERIILNTAQKILNKNQDALTFVNVLSIPYNRPVYLPESWSGYKIERMDKENIVVQNEKNRPVVLTEIPPFSFVTILKKEKEENVFEKTFEDDLVLENEYVFYRFNKDAVLIEAVEKSSKRSFIAENGKGNLLTLYQDYPNDFDAWEVEFFYKEQAIENAVFDSYEVLTAGPVLKKIRFKGHIGNSLLQMDVSLCSNTMRLDFECKVNWKERHRMLRVSFDTSAKLAEPYYDIQYGWIRRPGDDNTSWDFAKFESVGQRYAGLSNNDGGFAILNDCKYGYSIKKNRIELNLLRSPSEPDPQADIHEHEFSYSFLPHRFDLPWSNVIPEAEQLNMPVITLDGYEKKDFSFPFSFKSDTVSLCVLKKAEKDDSLVIRLVETRKRKGRCIIKFNYGKVFLVETDLLERNEIKRAGPGKVFKITFKPFEIRTFKIIFVQ